MERARFQKTKVCKFWLEGRCLRGNQCVFAHGHVDVQPAPDLTKTRMCKYLGVCKKGASCGYAHLPKELRGVGLDAVADPCSRLGEQRDPNEPLQKDSSRPLVASQSRQSAAASTVMPAQPQDRPSGAMLPSSTSASSDLFFREAVVGAGGLELRTCRPIDAPEWHFDDEYLVESGFSCPMDDFQTTSG
eukprot:TRINITY_DN47540_c0_g1_i1.p1 TRINITY_DN47540_c0_g1~~TRINITY_DN47540_c0_g1_i1.p1  ORF type:complete len:215 (+),score=23.96 TRINITY_DN47540_c0_g1_i1:81-647(+)